MSNLVRPRAAAMAACAALLLSCSIAAASCWTDQRATEQVRSAAVRHSPDVAERLPTVLVCSGDEFAPGIGGDYNGGYHRIRIPEWQLGRAELYTVLVHELGHAKVALEGTDDGTAGGHGPAWMAAMLSAGFGGEARRVADQVPGAAEALAQVRPHGSRVPDRSEPPRIVYSEPVYVVPNRVVCSLQPQVNRFRDAWGRHFIQTVWIQVCGIAP